ncbi:proteasome activator pa28 beta subunit [Ancylostoma duodenale]|uniref:Proteasome activator pa28 beta subunit n=1 Tax=Ancylostoma duodenale TaxID=51022 RepID=A0A0C2GJY1_9BILA|nr:proteasome activator pa28 beta subunit [Ancylostoma duodenale]
MPLYGFINGSVPCNAQLADLMDQVRPLLRDAVEHVNKVKMWITLLIPRIEDGNNFGVSIQEETLGEVRNVESEAASFLDQMSRYFTSRAKLLTKVAKYPHVDDYRRAILDMDEKQFINIRCFVIIPSIFDVAFEFVLFRLVVLEMRNHFSTLYDIITKNIEKIKKPRNSNMEMLY